MTDKDNSKFKQYSSFFLVFVLFLTSLDFPVLAKQEQDVPETLFLWEQDEDFLAQWYIQEIDAQKTLCWMKEKGVDAGQGVVVAVIDTGVSLLHEDLIDNLWVNEAEANGVEGVDDDGNGYVDDIYGVNLIDSHTNMTDASGHGTMMAGIIAMTAGNGGGAGIAYGAKIMPVKVSRDGNFTTEKAVEGIRYAIAMGADIINMSFGTYYESELLYDAIKEASKSCLLVAAAGNEAYATEEAEFDGVKKGNLYPAAYDEVVGVMAENRSGRLFGASNFDSSVGNGAEYEIVAPGEQIYSTSLRGKNAYTKGTSPAAALVSGAYAVYLSMIRNGLIDPFETELSCTQIRQDFLDKMVHTMEFSPVEGVTLTYKKLLLSDLLPEASQEGESGESGSGRSESGGTGEGGSGGTESGGSESGGSESGGTGEGGSGGTESGGSESGGSESGGTGEGGSGGTGEGGLSGSESGGTGEGGLSGSESGGTGESGLSGSEASGTGESASSGSKSGEIGESASSGTGSGRSNSSSLSHSEIKKIKRTFQKKRPVISIARSQDQTKKARLTISFQKTELMKKYQPMKQLHFIVYRSKHKNSGFRLLRTTKKQKLAIRCRKQKYYYCVRAYFVLNGKKIKTKRSEAKICFQF